MANRKQLAILKQGVEAWNKWREENPDAKINLRGAKLNGLDLSEANFNKADIRGTNFRNAVLVGTLFKEVKAGHSRFGFLYQKVLVIAIILALLFSMISIYISIAILFQYIFIIYSNTSLFAFITSITITSLTLVSFVVFTFIKSKYKIITFIFYIISILTAIIPISILFSFVIFAIFSTNNGIVKISSFMIPEKNINFQNGKQILSMGDASITIGYVVIFISIVSYIIWEILHEAQSVAFIRKIFLFSSDFFTTNFQYSNLTYASFDFSQFKYSNFCNAIITKTSFKNTQGLQLSRFNGTILEDRDVRELLVRGNGQGLSLKGKNLQGAYLVNADLRGLDLRETDLMQANLSGADITGAKLYGSARENWIIDGIRCEYVYWDEAGEQRTPPDRDFRPGEFEELYKQLPTFEYFFTNSISLLDPLIMNRVVDAINERHKEFSLELVNFDKRGQPHATFTVCHIDYVEKAKEQIAVLYEKTIEYLMKENEDKKKIIDRLHDFIDQLIMKTPSLEGIAMGDTYNNYGQVAAMGKEASATGNTFFQQITADLSRLHEEMQRTAASPEQKAAAEDVAKAEQAARQQDEPAMRRHLKNAGKFALDCAEKIGTDVLTEYLKKITIG